MASKAEATPKHGSPDLTKPAAPYPDPEPSEPPKPHKTEEPKSAVRAVKPGEDASFYLRTEPKVVKCTWERFKNRFQNADKTGFEIATIELLMTSETLDEDIEAERLRRMDKERREKHLNGHRRPTQPRHAATWTTGLEFERIRINSSIVNTYLARVSGNSSWPLKPHTFLIPFAFLIHNQDMMRAELKKLKVRFGVPHSHHREATVQPREIGPPTKEKALEEAMVSSDAYQQMKCYVEFVDTTLIKHYNQFDEANHNKPKNIRFDDLWCLFRYGELLCRPNNSSAVRRQDRAAIFSPYFNGRDGLRTAHQGPSGGASASVDTHTVIRAKGISISNYKWDVSLSDDPDENDYRRTLLREPVGVEGFYLDYDGTKFAPVSTYIEIEFFRGEMEIHKLPVFPTRFLQNEESLFMQLRDRGQQFRDLVTKARGGRDAFFAHDGWSRTTTPLGKPITMTRQAVSSSWLHDTFRETIRDAMGVGPAAEIQPEYISSNIIVDFQEAYQTIPAWRPDFDTSKSRVDTMPDVLFDSFSIMCWADESREEEVTARVRELVVADDRVASVLWNNLVQTDPFSSSDPNDDTAAEKQIFEDRDLVLLPSRVMAYSLRDRKFFNADVSSIREITWPPEDTSPFNLLKINQKHKDMILAIVHEHFDKKTLAAQLQQLAASHGNKGGGGGDLELTLPDQDFIRGKGQGLVILLHGAPGVGKTATAEAVALSRRRPLFLITCGDLGTTPETVEGGLKQIFRLASLWDCILLLDEADIFLSQRERGDESITRNAMVSIFLRTLEYYPGILFLTTNRPGVLDEAVKSRVHVSLNYPAFTLDQTLELFKMNIGRLEDIEKARVKARRASKGSANRMMTIRKDEILRFARKHYDGEKSLRWNGRQIRNAFQIAASLAHFQQRERAPEETDGNGSSRHRSDRARDAPPYIGKKHFKQVAEATAEFDRMRRELHDMSDSELAYRRVERAKGPDPKPDDPYHHGSSSNRPRRGARAHRDDGSRHHRSARSGYYDDDDDDGYYGNGVWPDERTSRRGGGRRGYAEDGFADPPLPRRDRHRDGSPPYEHDRYNDPRDRHADRALSASESPSGSRSRAGSRSSSRSSSPPEAEARHHARDGNTKKRESTKTSGGRDSGRREGGKSGPGGEVDKYGRRRAE
ncbi:uncharacterized protein B0H64DRAFT_435213 [Chaetomium fimeti]|uniref:AAA+ ATPase domain-containing protein n=1 Tax=Chaetomium fimeti TaxID=1854472 RepID=A0AAE0H9I8_9PEZI|nr:hypothetical protein B0H64DRAFT_435213 [Chaetomium fimeti]